MKRNKTNAKSGHLLAAAPLLDPSGQKYCITSLAELAALPPPEDDPPFSGEEKSQKRRSPDGQSSQAPHGAGLRFLVESSPEAFLQLASAGIREVRMCISFDDADESNDQAQGRVPEAPAPQPRKTNE